MLKKIQTALKEGKTPVFAYGRISSLAQDDGTSLEFQESHADLYAKKHNLETVIVPYLNEILLFWSRFIDEVSGMIWSRNIHDLL